MTERGFILLEVVVGLAILALSLTVLYGALSDGMRRLDDASTAARAAALAQSLLAALGRESPLQDGDSDGAAPPGFRWHPHIAPYGGDQPPGPVTAHAVRLDIRWKDRGKVRSLSLETLRLAVREEAR